MSRLSTFHSPSPSPEPRAARRLRALTEPLTSLPTILVVQAQHGVYSSPPEIVEVRDGYPPSAKLIAEASDRALAALTRQIKIT